MAVPLSRYKAVITLFFKRKTTNRPRCSTCIPHRFSQHGVELALGEFRRAPHDWLTRHEPRHRTGTGLQLIARPKALCGGLSSFYPLAQVQQLAICLLNRADQFGQRVWVGNANRGTRRRVSNHEIEASINEASGRKCSTEILENDQCDRSI